MKGVGVVTENAVEEDEPGRVGPDALVFVHLSDLHFRDGTDPLAEREAAQRDKLLKDVPKAVALAHGKLEAVLLTGDLARTGQKAEYDVARGWLDDLCGALGLHETSTLMCPGNHDVDRGALDLARRTLNHSLRDCAANVIDGRIDDALKNPDFVLGPVAHYQEFAARCACDVEQCLAWELEEPIPFGDGYGLSIRGASTVINSDAFDGPETMAVHTNQMIVKDTPGVMRMLLMHHGPSWWRRPEPGPADLDNHLVLYGHTHEPDHRMPLPSCLEVTAGAVHPEEHEYAVPAYNVIEISIDGTRLPEDPDRAYARVRVFRREFDRKKNKFRENGPEPTVEEWVEIPRLGAGSHEQGAAEGTEVTTVGPGDDAGGVDGDAEPQPPLETPDGEPNPSRRVRAAFERLGSGDRITVMERLELPVDEIVALPPHRQIREVARRVVADNAVRPFFNAVNDITGRT
jgi:hypothetical protein